tara:strand:+ start:136 stop:615 length:480 start_codon:yes stop_codon:yes gene_type:complete
MQTEIERKFLVKFLPSGIKGVNYTQGYLQSDKNRTIRIRTVKDNKANTGFLTIKGLSNKDGISRYEFETEIPYLDAKYLLTLCDKPYIEKTRYHYKLGEFVWEIDQFHGENDGLLVAEIELVKENQKFEKPDFIGTEITGDKKYYNLMLSQNPYKQWIE